jgi:hypothetical protein
MRGGEEQSAQASLLFTAPSCGSLSGVVLQVPTPKPPCMFPNARERQKKPGSRRLFPCPKTKTVQAKEHNPWLSNKTDIEMRRVERRCALFLSVSERRGLSGKLNLPGLRPPSSPLLSRELPSVVQPVTMPPVRRPPDKQKHQGSVRRLQTSPILQRHRERRTRKELRHQVGGSSELRVFVSCAHTHIMLSALSPLSLRGSQTPNWSANLVRSEDVSRTKRSPKWCSNMMCKIWELDEKRPKRRMLKLQQRERERKHNPR